VGLNTGAVDLNGADPRGHTDRLAATDAAPCGRSLDLTIKIIAPLSLITGILEDLRQ